MVLLVLGINHNSASLDIREKVAFLPEQMDEALADARGEANLQEVAILSTCNRTEIIALAGGEDARACCRRTLTWMAAYHHVAAEDLEHCHYSHCEEEALRHMMRVASGLDSMVLGEPQIFGQMKTAYSVALEAGAIGGQLGGVFQQTFAVAKRARTDTAIGENPVSVAYAAVSLANHIFSDLSKTQALLIGAGETIELVAQHLVNSGVKRIVIANRTLQRGRELAQRYNAEAILLAEIPEKLSGVDIVITSTASQLPILGKGAVEQALKKRKHRPIFMVDIAVPRDIEAQVGDLADVYLYSIDDLKDIIEQNKRTREDEALKAGAIIEQGVQEFQRQRLILDVKPTLRAFRGQAEECRDAELEKALRQLENGNRPEEVLSNLARGLTNKLIHTPCVQMKKASAEGRQNVIVWTQELFGLSDDVDDGKK